MKNISLIVFYLLLNINMAYSDTNKSDLVVYQDRNFPYSVMYLKSWVQTPISNPYTRFKIGEGNADFNINVVPNDNPKLTAEKYVKYMLQNPSYAENLIKKAIPNSKIIERGKTYLSNHDAFYILSEGSYRYLDEHYYMIIYQIQTYIDDNSYTLTFRCPKNEYDSYINIFNAMAKTFVVRPNLN